MVYFDLDCKMMMMSSTTVERSTSFVLAASAVESGKLRLCLSSNPDVALSVDRGIAGQGV